MNAYEMMNLLALRLEDADKGKFPDAFKLKALNNAQIAVANKLDNDYLTELEVVGDNSGAGITITAGKVALNSSTLVDANGKGYGLLRGAKGIQKIKVHGTNGLYMHMIEMKDVKKTENQFLGGSASNPLCYVFANNLYVLPTSVSLVDIFFLKVPAPLYAQYTATGGTQTTILTTDTQLGTDGQELSQTADAYNGAIIYNVTDDTYFKIKDYAYSDPTYTFTVDDPGAGTAGENGEKFLILTHDFDTLNLESVACQLNEALHELVVTFAEAECWAMARELDRRNAALENGYNEIKVLNERAIVERAEGIGTDRKGR